MGKHFAAGAEAAWGTAIPVTDKFEALSESVQMERSFESVESIASISPSALVELNALVRGDVEILAGYEGFQLLLLNLFPTETDYTTDDTPESGLDTHIFGNIEGGDRQLHSLTLEFWRGTYAAADMVFTYPGAKITSMSHSFSVDQSSRITFGFIAKTETTGTSLSGTPTLATPAPLFPKHVGFSVDGGSSVLPARSVTINIESPVDETNVLGTVGLAREPQRSGVQRVTFTAEVLFENLTEFYNLFDGSTVVDVQLDANNGLATTLERSWTYDMAKCLITQATPHMSGRDRVLATVEGESYYDSASTQNVVVTLVNSLPGLVS
jgi:hypothetical protein